MHTNFPEILEQWKEYWNLLSERCYLTRINYYFEHLFLFNNTKTRKISNKLIMQIFIMKLDIYDHLQGTKKLERKIKIIYFSKESYTKNFGFVSKIQQFFGPCFLSIFLKEILQKYKQLIRFSKGSMFLSKLKCNSS